MYDFAIGEVVSISDLKIMIYEGTEDKPYEKYGATPSTKFPSMPKVVTGVQKIKQFGRNWLNFNNLEVYKNANSSYSIKGTNSITVTSSSTNSYLNTAFKLNLEDGTYIFNLGNVQNSNSNMTTKRMTLSVYTNGTRQPIQHIDAGQSYNITITNENNKIYVLEFWGNYNTALSNTAIFSNVYIAKESTFSGYEEYNGEDITLNLGTTELCAIKDTNRNVVAKDRPVYRNSKWQWEKNIKKLVLNGTENWTDDTVSTVNHFRGKLDNLTYSKTNNAYCDKFICRTSEAHGEWEYIYIIGKACFINIDNTKLTEVSLNGFKTWLSSNNVTVYYVLATPEYIDCTAEQSAVLDKLYNNFTLQKGTNNIIVENENGVGVNLELDYMQDNILKDKKLEDRVTALENLLSTTQTLETAEEVVQ